MPVKDRLVREREKANAQAHEEYKNGVYCRHGHELRKGPVGLRICDECTLNTLEAIKGTRRRDVGALPPMVE